MYKLWKWQYQQLCHRLDLLDILRTINSYDRNHLGLHLGILKTVCTRTTASYGTHMCSSWCCKYTMEKEDGHYCQFHSVAQIEDRIFALYLCIATERSKWCRRSCIRRKEKILDDGKITKTKNTNNKNMNLKSLSITNNHKYILYIYIIYIIFITLHPS